MILLGSGAGVVIEAWKVIINHSGIETGSVSHSSQITKAVDIRVITSPPGSLLPYKLDIRGLLTVADI
jgi:hypothetical protein